MTNEIKSRVEERAKWMHDIITKDCGVVSMESCRTIAEGWALSDALFKLDWLKNMSKQLEALNEQGD
jgi:hypothetical protein